jgi:hypothetical protein
MSSGRRSQKTLAGVCVTDEQGRTGVCVGVLSTGKIVVHNLFQCCGSLRDGRCYYRFRNLPSLYEFQHGIRVRIVDELDPHPIPRPQRPIGLDHRIAHGELVDDSGHHTEAAVLRKRHTGDRGDISVSA